MSTLDLESLLAGFKPEQLYLAADAEECERDLATYLQRAWPAFDPSPFSSNWHVDAIAEHLEAVAYGEIRKLLINVSPRAGKTNLLSVAFPTWVWAKAPDPKYPLIGAQVRFLCTSYGTEKAQEDGVTARRLIGSKWYQDRWGSRVKICFPYDQPIQTERGPIAIGALVESRSTIKVASWSGHSVEYCPISGWHTNRGDEIYQLTFSNGQSVQCTGDHKFLLSDGSWAPALSIPVGAVFCVGQISGFGGSRFSSSDVGDVSAGNSVPLGQDFLEVAAKKYFPHGLCTDFGGVVRFAKRPRSMLFSIVDIIKASSVAKIAGACVRSIAIGMPNLLPNRALSYEGAGNNAVKFNPVCLTPFPQIEMGVPVGVQGRLHNHTLAKSSHLPPRPLIGDRSCNGSDLSEAGNFVPSKSDNRNPNLVRLFSCNHVGYATSTYCLTVPKYDNIMIGDNQAVIASNCRDRDNQERYDNEAGGSRVSTGLGGAILGRGGDIKIIDDPIKTDDANSEIEIRNVIRSYDEMFASRETDPRITAEIIIMQRLNESDLSGHVLSKEYGFDHLMIPMEYEWDRHCVTSIGWSDPRGSDDNGDPLPDNLRQARDGILMWPERFGESELKKFRAQPYVWAGQFAQRPEPRGGGIIKPEWWQIWPPEGEKFDVNGKPLKPLNYPPMEYVVAYLDTALTTKQENDPSAMEVWGVWRGADATQWSFKQGYEGQTFRTNPDGSRTEGTEALFSASPRMMLMEAWEAHLAFHDLVDRVIKTCRKRRVDRLVIEAKANGHSVAQEIQRLCRGEEFGVSLDTLKKAGDKDARLHSVEHLFTSGLVYAPVRGWSEKVKMQCSAGSKGAHDEYADCASGALRFLRNLGLAQTQREYEEDSKSDFDYRTVEGWYDEVL